MKFREIFRFEITYQLQRTWPWLFFLVLLVLSFLMARDGSLSEVLYADFFLNAPFAVAKTTVFGSLVWLVMAAAVAGDAGARDSASRMHALIYTTSISKTEYLGARFLAAFVLNAFILLAVQAGILLGVYLPGVDPELIGPFRSAAYLNAYAFIALPNAFIATALQFALAVRSGRTMAGYFGSFLLVFMGFFVAGALLYKQGLGTLVDPIGIRFVVEDLSHLWTTVEMSWRLVKPEGKILTNRLLWSAIAIMILLITFLRFRFTHRTQSSWWWPRMLQNMRKKFTRTAKNEYANKPIPIPMLPQSFGFGSQVQRMLAIAGDSFRTLSRSWAGIALLVALPLLTIPVVLDQMVSNDVPLVPKTIQVLEELTAPLSAELSRWVIIPFLIIYFSGELVWREREAGLAEITDAMPGPAWTSVLGKLLGLAILIIVFLALLAISGIIAQLVMGYHDVEPLLYAKILFGLQLPEYLLIAPLAICLHVVADQKYIGHLVAVIAYVFITLSALFGIEHDLLVYGAGPGWTYSEMSGFGNSLAPWLWFKGYWLAWALLLVVVSILFWVRGRERGLKERIQAARNRFTGYTGWTAGIAFTLILLLGGFIFYNTNVLNEYRTASDKENDAAAYERRYGRYAGIAQPTITATNLKVEIYPEQRKVAVIGTYHLVNHSAVPIDSVHIATEPAVATEALAFDKPAATVVADKDLGHCIYALETPVQPGDSVKLNFRVLFEAKGFGENGIDPSVAGNSSYFTNSWLPRIGYQSSRNLMTAADRRKHGLKPRPLIPSLYDSAARMDQSRGIRFDAVIGTQEDQVAVAPGALRSSWTEGKRRYFHYATDGPIGGEWAFFSAKYAVRAASWKDSSGSGQEVVIRIFHHPQHTAHLDRMVWAIRSSLDYYTKQFGTYRHSHISVVERPGNGTGMHADASLLSHGEGFTLWNPDDEPGSHDHPFAIVAHEVAHQWTVPSAFVEGAPVLSESLAWYYGMKVVEKARGAEHLQQLLRYMRQPSPYSPIRRGEPLLRGIDTYLSYRRGPFALYTLSEYVGEEKVNSALRRLLKLHRSEGAPLATTLDLFRELKAVTPDSLQYLLHDLFEVNTYWELELELVTAQQTVNGSWNIQLEIQAEKIVYASSGTETKVPMNDWIEVGLFAADEKSKPVYLQQHRIRSGRQKINLSVKTRPARAGIDPRSLMIDLNTDNNVKDLQQNNDASFE